MRKNFLVISSIIFFAFMLGFSFGAKAETSEIVYPSQWNIEGLVFTLAPSSDDELNALTVKNFGIAPYLYFEKIILYEDDGDGVFEGWKRDTEIGEGTYYDSNGVWYWKDLKVALPREGKKFFIAFETKNNGNITVDRRIVQLGIPILSDSNNNGLFDLATDVGIFTKSKINGPQSETISSKIYTIYKKSNDDLVPKSVITYPIQGATISVNSIIITGASRDQGGSTPNSVQVNISKTGAENSNWNNVTETGTNYSGWKFNWNNIENGTYNIKIKTSDWIGNIGEESGIEVVVDTMIPSATPTPEPTITLTPTPVAENIADGGLIREIGAQDIYIVKIIGTKKFKRLILNPEIFNSYGHLKWSDVKDVARAVLDSYTTSDLVIEINADGSIANPKVFRISSAANSDVGQKRWLNISAAQFEAAGLDWDSVFKINHAEASKNFYPEGAAITSL